MEGHQQAHRELRPALRQLWERLSCSCGDILANFHPAASSSFSDSITNGIFKAGSHTFPQDLNWIFSPRGGFAYDLFGKGQWCARRLRRLPGRIHSWKPGERLDHQPPWAVRPTFNDGSTAAPVFGFWNLKYLSVWISVSGVCRQSPGFQRRDRWIPTDDHRDRPQPAFTAHVELHAHPRAR